MSNTNVLETPVVTPTVEFVIHRNDWFGILDDVIPFAESPDRFGLPMLQTVQVKVSESGLITAAATDRFMVGRRRYQLTDHDGPAVEILLPLDAIKDLRRIHAPAPRGALCTEITVSIIGKGQSEPLPLSKAVRQVADGLDGNGGSVTVTSRKGSVTSSHFGLDATYVDVNVFLTDDMKSAPVERIAWNPELMARFAKVKRPSGTNVVVRFESTTRPIRIDIGDQFSGAIMPARLS